MGQSYIDDETGNRIAQFFQEENEERLEQHMDTFKRQMAKGGKKLEFEARGATKDEVMSEFRKQLAEAKKEET